MLEFEVVFVMPDQEESFIGTAAEVALEVDRRAMIFGTCEYYIPRKVTIITEVE